MGTDGSREESEEGFDDSGLWGENRFLIMGCFMAICTSDAFLGRGRVDGFGAFLGDLRHCGFLDFPFVTIKSE